MQFLVFCFPLLYETGYLLWYASAFIYTIQVFHVFKKETYMLNLQKIFLRIFLPCLIAQLLPLIYVFIEL